MKNNKTGKDKILVATSLLLCLLTLSLLPTVLSLDASIYVHALGSVNYDNPTTPPLPPPQGMPTDYIAYSGFEEGTSINPASACWEENVGVTTYWVGSSGLNYMTTSDPYLGSRSMRLIKWAGTERNCFTLFQTGNLFTTEFYTSGWYKLNTYDDFAWSVPWVFRNNYGSRAEEVIALCPRKDGGGTYWYMGHGTNQGYHTWQVSFYDTSIRESWTNQGTITMVLPHEVPIGRWFRVEVYVKRDYYNGIFKFWITDPENPDPSRRGNRLLVSVEGVQNSYDSTPENGPSNYLCPFTKLYGGVGSGAFTLNADIQVDELYIYNYNAHQEP